MNKLALPRANSTPFSYKESAGKYSVLFDNRAFKLTPEIVAQTKKTVIKIIPYSRFREILCFPLTEFSIEKQTPWPALEYDGKRWNISNPSFLGIIRECEEKRTGCELWQDVEKGIIRIALSFREYNSGNNAVALKLWIA